MYFIVTIAIACALAIGREAATEPVSMVGLRCGMMAGGAFSVCMSARLIHLHLAGQQPTARNKKATEILERVHLGFWAAVVAFLVLIIDWGTIVRTNWGWNHAVLVDEILILIPLTVPWVVSWAYFYDLPADATGSNNRWQFVARQSRITFGLGLLPVLVVCIVGDLLHWFRPELSESRLSPVVFVVPLLAILSLYPWLMRLLWPTRVLPQGTLRTRLERLAAEHNIAIRDMLVWETGNGTLNAAVSGIIPGLRYVFLTDGLLRDMSEDEIEAIYAHELGHVQHGHLILRILALLLPIFACMGFTETLTWFTPASAQPSTVDSGWIEAFTLFATVGYMFFALGWYARRLEHQADLWACLNVSGNSQANPVEEHPYFRVLQLLTSDEDQSRASWLHPSPDSRLNFLKATAVDHHLALRFERKLRMLSHVMLAVATWAISMLVVSQLG